MMFLNQQELHELTGYKRPSSMRRWLGENGYRYDVARDGYPRVLRAFVTEKLGHDERSDEWVPSITMKH